MIHSFYHSVLQKRVLLTMVIVVAIIQLSTLPNRYIETDESWLAEHSYSFLHEGIVRLKTMPEILGLDTRSFVYHKLFAWFGAVVISIFGFAITPLKISAFLFYLAFLYLLYKHVISRTSNLNKAYLALLLVMCAPLVIRKSYSFRPDMMLMFFSFAVYYFLTKYRKHGDIKWVVVAGVLAGLGFLTHLNGVAFCVAGFLFLAVYKKFKAVVIFSLVAIPICAVYFLDLLPAGNFDTFLYQITNWPTVNHGDNYIGGGAWQIVWGRIEKLLSEHQRFFWSDRVIGLSAIFFLSLIVGFRKLWADHRPLLLYMLLSVLALNIFGSHVAERYAVFYYGFMALISMHAMFYLLENGHAATKLIMLLLVLLQFAFASKELSTLYTKSYNTVESHRYIVSQIPDSNPKILVPWELIFNDFEKHDFYSYKTYEYLGEKLPGGKMTQAELLHKADELGMDYIIVNDLRANDKHHWFYQWEVVANPYYSQFYKDDRYMILKHQ